MHAKRLVAGLKKGRATSKLVREISVAAKMGGPELDANARLAAAVEKARRESVSREVIERAIKKGAGIGDEKLVMDHIVFEGYAPHKVAVLVEVYTDNVNRTAPEIRQLFRSGQLGAAGSNKFLFDHVGLVEAHHPDPQTDLEAAGIEAGANEVEPLTGEQNDDIPTGAAGARFICDAAQGGEGKDLGRFQFPTRTACLSSGDETTAVPFFITTSPPAKLARRAASRNVPPAARTAVKTAMTVSPAPVTSTMSVDPKTGNK